MSALRPEHYLQAAKERLEQAGRLYHHGTDYALVIYVAGLAVECLFRAFKARRDPVFDEKHDLQRLLRASGIQHLIPEEERRPFREAVLDVALLWFNALRYYSEDRMRKHLKSDPVLRRGIKGDILKEHARRILESSRSLVSKGMSLWTS